MKERAKMLNLPGTGGVDRGNMSAGSCNLLCQPIRTYRSLDDPVHHGLGSFDYA